MSNSMVNMGSKINIASFFPDYQRSAEVSTRICFSNVASSGPPDLAHIVATLPHIILLLMFLLLLFVILHILNLDFKTLGNTIIL